MYFSILVFQVEKKREENVHGGLACITFIVPRGKQFGGNKFENFSLVVRKSLSVIYFQISDKSLSDNCSLDPETLMDQKKYKATIKI